MWLLRRHCDHIGYDLESSTDIHRSAEEEINNFPSKRK
jgi:hypothetical protein